MSRPYTVILFNESTGHVRVSPATASFDSSVAVLELRASFPDEHVMAFLAGDHAGYTNVFDVERTPTYSARVDPYELPNDGQ